MTFGMTTLSTALAAFAIVGAAHAETAAPASMPKIVWSAPPAMNLSDPRLSPAGAYAERDPAPDSHGMPKTAIDHRFASDSAVGAVGYLCGLQPGPNERGGPASAFDPEGTFLGGQLTLAFK